MQHLELDASLRGHPAQRQRGALGGETRLWCVLAWEAGGSFLELLYIVFNYLLLITYVLVLSPKPPNQWDTNLQLLHYILAILTRCLVHVEYELFGQYLLTHG